MPSTLEMVQSSLGQTSQWIVCTAALTLLTLHPTNPRARTATTHCAAKRRNSPVTSTVLSVVSGGLWGAPHWPGHVEFPHPLLASPLLPFPRALAPHLPRPSARPSAFGFPSPPLCNCLNCSLARTRSKAAGHPLAVCSSRNPGRPAPSYLEQPYSLPGSEAVWNFSPFLLWRRLLFSLDATGLDMCALLPGVLPSHWAPERQCEPLGKQLNQSR